MIFHPTAEPVNAHVHIDYLQEAYLYRSEFGFSVFPVNRKIAVTGWKKYQNRRPTDREITRDFRRRHDGLAAMTGAVSYGLCVRDFDTLAGYMDWARGHQELARLLPTARTSRGAHVYFRLPKGVTAYHKWTEGTQKGELLGDGKHYVVLPPSYHPSGCRYQWEGREPFSRDDLPVLTPEQASFLTTADKEKNSKDSRKAPQERAKNLNTLSVTLDASTNVVGCAELSERDAVMRCLPTGPGERNECLWRLARTLKSLPHVADADEAGLWPFLDQWYQMAEPVIGTKSMSACWSDFKRQWQAALPIGIEFREAMRAAIAAPHPPEAANYSRPPVRALVAVCAALQRFAGDGPFYLSCRTAQELCGFANHMAAWRWLERLARDGLLEVTERGKSGTDRRRASRYRWAGATAH
jgi:hypothetical protein